MSTQPTRVRRNLKANTGRLIRVEQLVGRLEKRLERLETQNAALKAEVPKKKTIVTQPKLAQLEKQNASLKAEIAKLRAKLDQNTKDAKHASGRVARLAEVVEPVRALVKSFKQTPGAPFDAWRLWMVGTFRKQGLYRKQMFR